MGYHDERSFPNELETIIITRQQLNFPKDVRFVIAALKTVISEADTPIFSKVYLNWLGMESSWVAAKGEKKIIVSAI